ncbi:hypothetical protein C8R46DRAFT_1287519 [Mycena filopes]|nr:hypothetical protein C8R46DRAFT_1287519 [Mycena filopes]
MFFTLDLQGSAAFCDGKPRSGSKNIQETQSSLKISVQPLPFWDQFYHALQSSLHCNTFPEVPVPRLVEHIKSDDFECGCFVASHTSAPNFSYVPHDPREPCAACTHPWIHHLADASTDTDNPYRKGTYGPNGCGGFLQASPSSPWGFTVPCVCGVGWANHEAVRQPTTSVPAPAPPATGQPPPPPFPPSVPPPLSTLHTSLPPPISTFTGPSSSGATTANENRNAAISRHFPKPSKSKKYKPPHAYPASIGTPSTFQALVTLWPNVLPNSPADDGTTTIDFAYTIDQFTEMLLTLKAHGLAFVATLPTGAQTDLVQQLSTQLDTQLHAHGLVLPRPPDCPNDTSTLLFRRPWFLLESTRCKAVYTFSQHTRANTNNFDHKLILDMKFVNPDVEHGGIPIIVLGVRYGPVKGALPRTLSAEALDDAFQLHELHSCLGQRLLYGLPHSSRDWDAQCLGALCPDAPMTPVFVRPAPHRERTPAAMVATSSRVQIRPRSPESPSPARTRRRTEPSPEFIEVLSSDDEDLIPQPLLPPRRVNPPRMARPSPASVVLADGAAIAEWQTSIWIDAVSVLESETVDISGANITGIAEFIVALFLHLRLEMLSHPTTFPQPPDIHRPRVTMTHHSFLQAESYRSYAVSVGRGVESAVWRNVITFIAADGQLWRPTTLEPEHVTFILSPTPTTDRLARFYAYGQLLAIHLYYYGHGLGVGLWPVLVMALGRESMLLGPAFLRVISPSLALELRPWFALRPEDPIPTALSDPVAIVLMETLDIQPSLVPTVRTRAQHDDITVKLMTRKVLGYDSDTFWSNHDFLSTYSGFDMALSHEHGFAHVQTLGDVTSHLEFHVLAPATAAQTVTVLRSLFELRFKRYLEGHGHPQWFYEHGLISTEEEMQRGRDTPFLRTELLLLTALESSLLPIKDSWKIRFTVSAQLQSSAEDVEALPLGFHTCTGGIDVRVNKKLMALLIYSPQGSEDTAFDVWVHTQLYNADLAYNTI